jgi:dTDP-glucose 4,6-dehydratase
MIRILITGGCGFAGAHTVEHFLKNTTWEIVILDKLTYAASGLDRVRDIQAYDDKRVTFFSVDLTRPISEGIIKECANVDYVLHMAAETHVDRSIQDPGPFIYSNVVGTYNILEFVRELRKSVFGPKVFCYFSTDEVYGPAPEGVAFKEWDRYNCTNPYAATKAGAEQLTLSYMNCYKIPGFIVNCMNLFGERQHPEKFIPLCIRKIEAGEEIQIHGTPDGKKSGSRFYIHARNMAAAVNWLFYKYTNREKYNIVGERELTNLEVAQMIADVMGKELKYRIVNFHESRPGHDLRYALDGSKLEQMGYKIPITIENSLRKTVEWTLNNRKWLEM